MKIIKEKEIKTISESKATFLPYSVQIDYFIDQDGRRVRNQKEKSKYSGEYLDKGSLVDVISYHFHNDDSSICFSIKTQEPIKGDSFTQVYGVTYFCYASIKDLKADGWRF